MEALFFVGNQLIATSHTGRIGVWNAVTKHWQVRTLASLAPSFPGVPGGLPLCPTPWPKPETLASTGPDPSWGAAVIKA